MILGGSGTTKSLQSVFSLQSDAPGLLDSICMLSRGHVMTIAKHAIPGRQFLTVSESYEGTRFFTEQNGARIATPLLLVLAVVELSDVVFAVDSIPAVRWRRPPGGGGSLDDAAPN
jgi:predicted tellurium resistance membrane protein TerC